MKKCEDRSDYILGYNHPPLYFTLGYDEWRSEGGSNYVLGYNPPPYFTLNNDECKSEGGSDYILGSNHSPPSLLHCILLYSIVSYYILGYNHSPLHFAFGYDKWRSEGGVMIS